MSDGQAIDTKDQTQINENSKDSGDEIFETPAGNLPPIWPWKYLKRALANITPGCKINFSGIDIANFRKQNAAINSLTSIIPYGFQLSRSIIHPKPTIKSAIFTSTSKMDYFLISDNHNVHIHKGRSKPVLMSTDLNRRGHNSEIYTSVFTGLSRWTFISKWKMTVIATLQLELKVLCFQCLAIV
ncbi:hypothetical protein HK100_000993 [Physocladia obscura]|uniref:Uncharacterized protein n=1 Tax=Physocladia obscura TaxID=109957 RepID=A0AAD5XC52_9FUNG|nr:hypothetical protein HK100_000993 [Physocladia obscura]